MPKINNTLKDTDLLHQSLADLVNTTESLSDFAEMFFDLILEDTSISDFALAFYDAKKDIVSFPFARGKRVNPLTQALQDINSPLGMIIAQHTALVIKADEYLDYCNDGTTIETIPTVWCGLPVFKNDQLFAIIILIATHNDTAIQLEAMQADLTALPKIFSPYLELKLRLEALENNEIKYRRFVEASIDITFQITRSGYFDYISSNVETLFGCDPKSLIGKHFKVTTPINQVSKVIDALKDISKGKTIRNLSLLQKVKSGALVPMEVSASPISRNGDIIGAQGTMRDISERHQAQQEIERLAFFPLATPMPVVEVDLYGVPSYINPAGIQLLDQMNLDMDQVSEIMPKQFKSDIRAALSEKGQIPSREVTLNRLQFLWSAFFLHNHNLLHFYATDITNIKETERELIEAKEIAIQHEQVKTMFLANMSHEIRTPLNSILGFTELVEEEVKNKFDEDLQAYFEIIRVSGKRLWHTVHEILDISQIETGTFTLKIETIDLAKILRDLGASYRSKAETKNIELLVNIPSGQLIIAADEYCATQALMNLIDNAIKYTNTGYVKISTEIRENEILVYIKDTGIGMSREYQERMFKAFSQESAGYTKRFQGVGLGLALAHRYLKLLKAKIDLESEKEVGSTFGIHFMVNPKVPLTQPETATKTGSVAAPPTAPETIRSNVLVVEDDPNSRKLAGFTLKKDFELFFAESVAEAKEQLVAHDIELILLDLSLTGDEDGLDLARFLRSEDKWKTTPIIALTAHAFTSDRDRCMEAGCNDFMTKPFRRLELLEAINKLVLPIMPDGKDPR
ncbi:MAG: response regulator [Candidatus Marinimicrobia bacterium]|nr:response regulator [Candidatus Neomarinimicrobiota bacterium]